MKYMGSKKWMLQNGLGKLILENSSESSRVVDLFCGGGSIVWYVAERVSVPVIAIDLQAYAVVIARSVINRESPLQCNGIENNWLLKTQKRRVKYSLFNNAKKIDEKVACLPVNKLVEEARKLCGNNASESMPIWSSYGGYYYSPLQALTFDYLLKNIPKNEPEKSVCLASTISAASMCSASPGHTAQPFRPTPTAGPYIKKAWNRDPIYYIKRSLNEICPRYAKVIGKAIISDALDFSDKLLPTDLVIIDPPYSNVQYSRFYHVLETMARGKYYKVEGAGRYPSISMRPQSEFSKSSKAKKAVNRLLKKISVSGAKVILTFPEEESSNGLSGQIMIDIASQYFKVNKKIVNGTFSTLGGNNNNRVSHKPSNELILVLSN